MKYSQRLSMPGRLRTREAHFLPPRSKRAILGILIGVTVLQRVGLNFATYPADAGLIILYPTLVLCASAREWRIDASRLVILLILVVTASASAIINVENTSVPSLLLLGINYIPFAFVGQDSAKGAGQEWLEVANLFLSVALGIAVSGIAQFVTQFFVHPSWLFDFTDLLPEFLRNNQGYNTVIPVGAFFKSNGFFMREPSLFSQLMAAALLCELSIFKRVTWLVLFGIGLIISYSGTGLLVLAVGLIFALDLSVFMLMVLAGICILVLQLVLGDVLGLAFTIGRLEEFTRDNSSGYQRFIAPATVIANSLFETSWSALIGHGPGSISRLVLGFYFFNPTWAKAVYEYGLIGLIASCGLVATAIFNSPAPLPLRVAWFSGWLLASENLVNTQENILTFVLFSLWVKRRALTDQIE